MFKLTSDEFQHTVPQQNDAPVIEITASTNAKIAMKLPSAM